MIQSMKTKILRESVSTWNRREMAKIAAAIAAGLRKNRIKIEVIKGT